MKEGTTPLWLRRTVLVGLLGGLVLVGLVVMQPFLVPIAWAAILTYALWPMQLRLLARTRCRRTWAAVAMTATLALALSAALLWLGLLLRSEGVSAFREVAAALQAGIDLPEPIARIPWLGRWLQERLTELGGDRDALRRQFSELADLWGGRAMHVVGDLGLNALRFAVSLVTAFFMFRDGDRLLEELRGVLTRLLGDRTRDYFNAVGDTTRAVVYGLLLGALAQGVMAGLGYWAVGLRAPVFWGAATAMVALLPWGAPVVWGSIGAWLVVRGDVGLGLGLLLWGALVVSWIDNLVRPWIISGVANVPFLLVLFGVLGGLAAFGLIGLFIGPVALAILLAVWREWVTGTLHQG